MIGLGKMERAFVSAKPTDMRKSFHALAALVVSELGRDPLSGAVFLFISRDMKRAKLIWWDGTGFCLFQKRLAKGVFAAPWKHVVDETVSLPASQLALFFDGSPLVFVGQLAPPEVEPRKLTTNIAQIR